MEHAGTTGDTDEVFQDDIEQNDQVTPDGNEQGDGQNLRHYMLARDRVKREIRPTPKYAHANVIAYDLNIGDNTELDDLVSFDEACNNKNKADWFKVMQEELDSFIKNNTWTLVKRPVDQKVIGCMRIYKRKPGIPEVEATRFKARVVSKGYS